MKIELTDITLFDILTSVEWNRYDFNISGLYNYIRDVNDYSVLSYDDLIVYKTEEKMVVIELNEQPIDLYLTDTITDLDMRIILEEETKQ